MFVLLILLVYTWYVINIPLHYAKLIINLQSMLGMLLIYSLRVACY